jgi:hypothetical protein
LALLQTYQTNLQLAKHYFFNGNHVAFAQTWNRLETDYELTEKQETELNRLGEVFDVLENEFSQGYSLNKLPQSTIENLLLKIQTCDEAAFLSKSILWRNGIRAETNCNGNEEREKQNIQSNLGGGKQIQLLPNPVDNQLTVKLQVGTAGQIKVVNQYGRVIYSADIFVQNEVLTINTAQFPSGVYFMAFRLEGNLPQCHKFIVQH